MNKFLSIHHLNVSYGETAVLRHFNLSVEKGSIYCLLGASGCGKSTLLKTICGIVKPSGGEILLKNEPVNPAKHSLGYIPQQYGLLDWLTVEANLFLGKKIRKRQTSEQEQYILEQLEIRPLLKRYPKELSGGQQQRVALARAWIICPDLLLMDEPFSSLDTFTAERSRELFLHLWKQQKTTTLFVTHNLREAAHIGKYLVLLPKQTAGSPEIVENPLFQPGAARLAANEFQVEQMIGQRMEEIQKEKIHD